MLRLTLINPYWSPLGWISIPEIYWKNTTNETELSSFALQNVANVPGFVKSEKVCFLTKQQHSKEGLHTPE